MRMRTEKGRPLSALGFQLGGALVAALVAAVGAVGPVFAEAPPADMGASVSVTVEPNGDTTVDVKSGDLKVKSGGVETRVGPGESVHAKKGQVPRKVLAAPRLGAPAEDAALAAQDIGFTWQKVRGANKYVLEVASTPELSSARTQTVEGTRGSVHLEPGTWYWRVVALDAAGGLGRPSVARRLTIDTTPPRLKTGKPEWR